MMRKRIERIDGKAIISAFARIAAASAVMSLVCYFSYHFLVNQLGISSFTIKIIEVFVPIVLGGIVFVLMAKILRVSEVDKLYNSLKRKFGRK